MKTKQKNDNSVKLRMKELRAEIKEITTERRELLREQRPLKLELYRLRDKYAN